MYFFTQSSPYTTQFIGLLRVLFLPKKSPPSLYFANKLNLFPLIIQLCDEQSRSDKDSQLK